MEDGKRWEGRVVDGRFPLRQYLGGSGRSAVFLTSRGENQNAAIKLIPLDPATVDQQLVRWKQAAELSHPNLVRLFEMGRCRMDDAECLYVVMESAEEDLSQILPQRALTPGEAQEMLGPVVEVLRYLHGKGWVHGHLKPSNILARGRPGKGFERPGRESRRAIERCGHARYLRRARESEGKKLGCRRCLVAGHDAHRSTYPPASPVKPAGRTQVAARVDLSLSRYCPQLLVARSATALGDR